MHQKELELLELQELEPQSTFLTNRMNSNFAQTAIYSEAASD